MKRNAKIAFYGLYTLLAVLFFLYVRFPSETVQGLISARLAQIDPLIRVSSQTVRPTLSAGLKFETLSVTYADMPLFTAESFKVTPELFALLRGQNNYDFSAPLGGGTVNGRVEMVADAQKPQTKFNVNLSGVPMEAFEIFTQWPDYTPSGDLNAYLEYDHRRGADAAAKLNFEITPAKVVFTPPLMGLAQLDFTKVQAEMSLSSRMLQIRRWEATGPQIESRVSGSIVLRQPVGASRVTLACTVKPQAGFLAEHQNTMLGGLLASANAQNRGMIFRISGTLDHPNYVMR
jgi:type II secretion system protein N